MYVLPANNHVGYSNEQKCTVCKSRQWTRPITRGGTIYFVNTETKVIELKIECTKRNKMSAIYFGCFIITNITFHVVCYQLLY